MALFGKKKASSEEQQAALDELGTAIFSLLGELSDVVDGQAIPGDLDAAVESLQRGVARAREVVGDEKAREFARQRAQNAIEVEGDVGSDTWTPEQQQHFQSLVQQFIGQV